MKQTTKYLEYTLSPAAVDAVSKEVYDYLKSAKVAERDCKKYALGAEEVLLKHLDSGYEGKPLRISLGRRLFKQRITVETDGEALNVFVDTRAEKSLFENQILLNLGLSPEYNYSAGTNSYSFTASEKSANPFLKLIIAIAAALAAGFAGLLLPQSVSTFLLDGVLTPLHNTFLNVLGCIAGPMIFLSVAWGIYGIGDAATLKQVGKKLLIGYVAAIFIFSAMAAAGGLAVFRLDYARSSGAGGGMSTIFDMVLGIFPKNIFSPFVDGNTLQIIFLAITIGIALIFLGHKTTSVARAVEQINCVVQFLIEFISRLVPYFIFIVIIRMIWSGTAAVFLKVIRLFAVALAVDIIIVLAVLLLSSVRNGVGMGRLFKKGFPTFLIAFTTASSAASFGTNMEACRNKFGISETISSFGIPLGMVTFKPASVVEMAVMALFFAENYGLEISASWVVLLVFTAAVLSLATPPIPGGALASYAVLFLQLGIPEEALAVALACDTLFDFINTGINQFLLPFILLNESQKLGVVDNKKLKSR